MTIGHFSLSRTRFSLTTRYKYIHMEEMVGNIAGARQVFERWMKWEPDHQGWKSYVKMELRYNEEDRARSILERYILCHPSVEAWVHYAKFEKRVGNPEGARSVYERAMEFLGEEADEELYIAFAHFEVIMKEFERARFIYKYALDNMPKEKSLKLHTAYIQFEKQHGDRDGIEVRQISERMSPLSDALHLPHRLSCACCAPPVFGDRSAARVWCVRR